MISISKLCSFYFPFDKNAVLTQVALNQGKTELEVEREWDKLRDEGIALHDKLHSFMIRQKYSNALLETEKGIEGYIGCIHWLMGLGYKIYGAEITFKHHDIGVLGRVDAIFEKDGQLLIIDWKSKTGHFEKENCKAPLQSFFNNKHHQYRYQLMVQGFLVENFTKKLSALAYVVQKGKWFEICNIQADCDLVVKTINNYKEAKI